jgi:hypothetical protein
MPKKRDICPHCRDLYLVPNDNGRLHCVRCGFLCRRKQDTMINPSVDRRRNRNPDKHTNSLAWETNKRVTK